MTGTSARAPACASAVASAAFEIVGRVITSAAQPSMAARRSAVISCGLASPLPNTPSCSTPPKRWNGSKLAAERFHQ